MSDPVHTVIVGWGRWGRLCHGLLASSTTGMTLHGVVSSDPAKRANAAETLDCRTYKTPEEAFDDPAAELVVLATPTDTHAGLAIAALSAGKHVLVEKPMAATLAEVDRMTAAATEAGRILSVFQNRRFDGDFLTLRQLFDDGRLGDLRWLEMAWQGFGPPGGWRGEDDRGGGRLLDLGPHLIDQMLLLIGDRIEGVWCRLRHEFESSAVESEAMLVLQFAGGRTGVIDVSSLAALPKPRFYARGTKATFEKYGFDPQEAALSRGSAAIDAAREAPESFGRLREGQRQTFKSYPLDEAETIPTQQGSWRRFYEHLRDAIRTDAPPPVTPAEARRVVAVIEAARQSAASGRVEPVDGESLRKVVHGVDDALRI